MIQINITNEPFQNFKLPFEDTQIEFELRYLVTVQYWQIDVKYKDEYVIQGAKLSAGVLMLSTFNKPFDIYIDDVGNIGIDPFDVHSFSDGYFTFNVVERSELDSLRGYIVQ